MSRSLARERRIMHISTRLILGGSQENTVLSCEGQADLGHTVSLVFGPIYGPEGSLLQRAEAHGGIECIETPHLVRELAPLKDFRCLRDLRTLIRAWRPDVVHTHSSKAGILGRMAAWRERVPCVVHTIHGLAFHPYQTWWRNQIYIRSERMAARQCHLILGVADAMCAQALAQGIGRPEQYRTVRSGMEVEPFLEASAQHAVIRARVRERLGIPPDAIVIGTVARLAELKGHDDLLDALAEDLRSDPRLRLLWVGDGWWRERLLGRARAEGLLGSDGPDRIVTTGLVPPQEIPDFHQAMDLLVHPSYREGLPRVVTQALLSGLPVAAYDVDGTREVCIDGKTGLLVPPGDRAALRRAVRRLVDDLPAARAMGAAGREACRHAYAAKTMVDALDDVYEEVLAEAGATRDSEMRR